MGDTSTGWDVDYDAINLPVLIVVDTCAHQPDYQTSGIPCKRKGDVTQDRPEKWANKPSCPRVLPNRHPSRRRHTGRSQNVMVTTTGATQ